MARAGMAALIAELRARCDAGTAEFTAGGQAFYSDDQLQMRLDRQRTDVRRVALVMEKETSGGSAVYHDYFWARGEFVEGADSGTAAWRVEDSAGSVVGTSDYSVNYDAKHIRFTANQQGKAYYLTYRAFDLDRTAAEVWTEKAAHVADRFDVATDNHDLKRSQLYRQFTAQAALYRGRAAGRSVNRLRSDVT